MPGKRSENCVDCVKPGMIHSLICQMHVFSSRQVCTLLSASLYEILF